MTFLKDLEEHARSLISKEQNKTWTASAPATLERDITLTLEHLTTLREQFKQTWTELLKQEAYLHTEMMRLNPNQPDRYEHPTGASPFYVQKLLQIASQRQWHLQYYRTQLHELQQHLLKIVNQHRHLHPL